MDAVAEPLYRVPTHLKARASYGIIPERSFYIGLAAIGIAIISAYLVDRRWTDGFVAPQDVLLKSSGLGLLVGLIPIVLLAPFALVLTDPPPEHGLVCSIRHLLQRRQIVEPLAGVRFSDGVIHTSGYVLGVLALATTNLDLASVAGRRGHHNRLGYLFDGISKHPFQILIRSKAQTEYGCLQRMQDSPLASGPKLAAWLREHVTQRGTIDRQRFMMIPADNEEILQDRMDLIMRSLKKAGVDRVRITDANDLREFVADWWPSGNIRVTARGVESADEQVSVYAVSGLPSMISTNWWQPLVDGDVPIDVVMTCQQKDLGTAKSDLSRQYSNLASSPWAADRDMGMTEIKELQYAFEGRVRPWNVQILLVVRGKDAAERDLRARRMQQMMSDLGGRVDLLLWEQLQGMRSAQPLCGPMLAYHAMYLESRTLVRTTPLSASSLQMLDGVLWGNSGAVPILLTTRHMRTGKHGGWYGFTGSGKDYGLKTYLGRRVLADGLRVFAWDTDAAHHEYSGRFTEYLEGQRLVLRTLEACAALKIDPRQHMVAFDVSEMDSKDWPAAFVVVKKLIQRHLLAYPNPSGSAFVVSEAMQILDQPDQQGARELADAVTNWRKWGCEVHVVTQRVSDWFNHALGQRIQGSLAITWYGLQRDTEITAIQNRVHWTPEEMERIAGAGTGEGLLIAFGRRVWSDLYDQCSPEEHAAYETDPVEERLELLKLDKSVVATESLVHSNGVVK